MSSEDADESGYTHTPASPEDGVDERRSSARQAQSDDVDAADDGKQGGPSGTFLVVVVALATLVIPGIIYVYPTLLADHVPFLVAMLALPFIPALLLGVVGVWAMKG